MTVGKHPFESSTGMYNNKFKRWSIIVSMVVNKKSFTPFKYKCYNFTKKYFFNYYYPRTYIRGCIILPNNILTFS